MAAVVYILCATLSFSCFYMLRRGYLQNGIRLLFWSSLGFLGFAFNNVLLFVDQLVITEIDLSIVRTLPALAGVIVLLYGLITDSI